MSSNNVPTSSSILIGSPDLTFPFRLFLLLKNSEEQQMEHVISWTPVGKGFKVHSPKEFEKKFLAKNFKMKKYASFTRQLCAYGFSCVRKGRQTGIYFHPSFIRENPDECSKITRGGSKSLSTAAKRSKSLSAVTQTKAVTQTNTHKPPPKVVSDIDRILNAQPSPMENTSAAPQDLFPISLYTDTWTVEPELAGRVSPEPSSPVPVMSSASPVYAIQSRNIDQIPLLSTLTAPVLDLMTRDLIAEDGTQPICPNSETLQATPAPMAAPGVWIDDDSFESIPTLTSHTLTPPQESGPTETPPPPMPQMRPMGTRGMSDSFEPIPLFRMEGVQQQQQSLPSTHLLPVPRSSFGSSPVPDISASFVQAILDVEEPASAYTGNEIPASSKQQEWKVEDFLPESTDIQFYGSNPTRDVSQTIIMMGI